VRSLQAVQKYPYLVLLVPRLIPFWRIDMTTTLNFNDLSSGTIVDNEYQSQGVTVSASGGSGQAMIFDTSNPTGGDGDLATSNLGNVLIISEDGDSSDPDDNGGGGTFTFAFDNSTSVENLTFLDNEEGAFVRFYDQSGQLISSQWVDGTSNNSQDIVNFNVDGVYSMEVELCGSGAIDNLTFDQNGISGDNADGIIEGTSGADVIDANYEGDPDGDEVDNNDAILTGEAPNDDIIIAGAGDDLVLAGDGDDKVQGNEGDDTLCGQDGNDTLHGGAGNDVLEGMNDNDVLFGGAGDDRVFGDAGNDIAAGGAGNDTIFGGSGDDLLSGGADDDVIEGGTGADTIYGDDGGSDGIAVERESFEWDQVADPDGGGAAGIDNGDEITGAMQNTGNENVTFSILAETSGVTNVFSSGDQNTDGIEFNEDDVDANSSFDSIINGDGGQADYQLEFTNEVSDVSFNINDVDGDGVVRVLAFDAQGNQIAVDLTGGSSVTLSNTDGVAGNDTANSNGGYQPDTNGDYAVTVSIAGPVARIVIEHSQDGPNNSGINITDVYFDAAVADTGPDGNDSIDGGDGADLIYGEGGDDTISGGEGNDFILAGDGADSVMGDDGDDTLCGQDGDDTLLGGAGNDVLEGMNDDDVLFGGAGDDSLYGDAGTDELTGGEGADLILGGANSDTIFGGAGDVVDGGAGGFNANPALNTDDDTLDLTGQGPFVLENVTTDGNGNGTNGTVVFVDGAGDPTGETLTFSEIENIIGDDVTNFDPDAVDDSSTTSEDTAIIVDLTGNDTDPNGDTLTVTAVSVPADQGTIVDNGDGTATFTPVDDFNGEATISYSITDGNGGTDSAIHTVMVTPVNDGPDAVNDGDVTDEDTAITVDLIANDTDLDGDTLTVTGATVPASQGTLVDNGDGTVTFTPVENFNGEATISYSITDGNGGTDTAIHTIDVTPVNDAPVAVDDIAETFEDEAVVIDLIGNDTDADGDPLNIGTVTVPAEQGTVVDNGDGTVTFTPAENYTGPASITYTVQDGQGGEDSGEAVVNVEVIGVNDGPQAVDDAVTTDEDTPITIDVLDNDFDIEGDDLSITAASVPADQGTVEIVDGELVFTPADDFNGEATITYGITDTNGGADIGEVIVTVTPVNDGPVAVDDIETTDEDQPIVIDLVGNDTDVDGDPLMVGTVTVPADQGTVVDNGDGTVTFTPADNFNGPATITYTVEDGQGGSDEGQAVVSVGAVNDGPVAGDGADVTDEDTAVTVDLLANDTDLDGDDLTVITATVPADQGTLVDNGDGTVTFTPAENFNGEATISYEISDSNGGTDNAVHVITVTPVNDGPDAVNDDAGDVVVGNTITINALENDTDPEDDPLTIVAASVPTEQGTVEIVGNQIEFTPAPDFEGEATISYTIEDPDGGSDTAEISVFVRDGIVTGTDAGELIDDTYTGDPGNDMVDSGDNVFSTDPADEDDDIIVAGGGNDTVVAGGGDDDIDGGTGDDQVNAGTGDDTIDGGEGNDTLQGAAGDDSIDGGVGDDSITGGGDDDTLTGGEGNDTLNGSSGNDSIDGGIGDDSILGGLGSDTVDGGAGNDVIDTGGRNAIDMGYPGVIRGEEGTAGVDDDRDSVDGGAGNDTITTGDDADTITGGSGDDVIDGGIDADSIFGDDGDDRIVGGEGSDVIEGGDGNDTIHAGNDPDLGLDFFNIEDDGSNPFGPDLRPDNGQDTVFGGDGNDLITGADDDDVLYGDAGNDTIDGGIDDDSLFGGTGDDSLIGGQGNDTLSGGDDNDLIDGGIGNDDLSGDGGRDTFINVNAGDVVDGGEAGDDFDTLDLSGSAGPGQDINIVYDPLNSENGTVEYKDDTGAVVDTLTFTNIENVIPCFTPGTLIATAKGERRVEELVAGDRIITRDNGIQAIRWAGAREMTGAEFEVSAHLKPILIQQGALGGGLPERDMMVSPQHRVLIANEKTSLYFEESEVLVAAKFLTALDGIDVVDVSATTYIHIMFDQHEVVLSDGAWTESFQPGDQTLAGVGDASRDEILEIFPELATRVGIDEYTSARRALKKHEAILLTK
jgi:Ca2+-binding RTX toxin-like protein